MSWMKYALAALSGHILVGCGSVEQVRDEIDRREPIARQVFDAPIRTDASPRVREMSGAMIPASEVIVSKASNAWLKAKRTDFFNAPRPVPVSQFIASLAAKGINISSDLPLDHITFTGAVNATDAESALRLVLGASGLDYQVDDVRQIVTIKPLPTKTWILNIGNRKSTYSSNGSAGGAAQTVSSNTGNTGGTTNGGAGGTQPQQGASTGQTGGAGQNSGQQPSQQQSSSTSSSAGSGATGVTSGDDFWPSLVQELRSRLKVSLPVGRYQAAGSHIGAPLNAFGIPGMPMPGNAPLMPFPSPGMNTQASGDTQRSQDLYTTKDVGLASVNPETGAVRVQAPHWILTEIDEYIRRVQQMYNTVVSFEGELVLITKKRSDSEGFDLQAFTRWAGGRYGAVISNNALGGVTLSFPNGNIPSVAANSQEVGGALLGIVSARDGLSIFNNYLKEIGNFAVKERLAVTTTSGVPGEVSTLAPRYYQLVNQNAVAGNTGAATQATSYTTLQKDFGTELKVNPRFDLATGLVRSQISVKNVVFAGEQLLPQTIGLGNSVQTIVTRIPLEKKLNYSGEALLTNGDLILLGGQSDDSLQTDENGLPTNGAPLSGIFGTKKAVTSGGTYYFVLHVSVSKR